MTTGASLCVKCGLCLAECPTYLASSNEANSPRGRVALIQALEAGTIAPSAHLNELLGSCLLCRRCERICPSGVPFGSIMDTGRERLGWYRPLRERLAAALITRPRALQKALAAAGLLQRLLPGESLARQVLARRDRDAGPLRRFYPACGRKRGNVGLFPGCSGRLLDAEALQGAVKLLTWAGYDVHVPQAQVCCGALDAHGGNLRRAHALQQKNEAVFGAIEELDALVSVAGGCGAHLAGYPGTGALHKDISEFLLDASVPQRLRFRPLVERVLVHVPCTLENVLRSGDAPLELLAAIPGLQIEELGSRGGCCGAGGLTFLSHPRLSRALRQPLVGQIERSAPRYVLTSNAGCGLHLQQGADSPEYLHPVTLLARQLMTD